MENENPKKYLDEKLDIFINEFLSEMGKRTNKKVRKAIARKVLLVFLGNYSCFAGENTKSNCKNLMIHFSSSINDMERNQYLDQAIQELVSHMTHTMDMVADKESVIGRIVFKLIRLYAGLSVSDWKGVAQCHELGKFLHFNWESLTPIVVTLSYLRTEKSCKTTDLALLKKLSF